MLLLTTVATYLLAQAQADSTLLLLAAAVVVTLFVVRLLFYRAEYPRTADTANPEAHAALTARRAYDMLDQLRHPWTAARWQSRHFTDWW